MSDDHGAFLPDDQHAWYYNESAQHVQGPLSNLYDPPEATTATHSPSSFNATTPSYHTHSLQQLDADYLPIPPPSSTNRPHRPALMVNPPYPVQFALSIVQGPSATQDPVPTPSPRNVGSPHGYTPSDPHFWIPNSATPLPPNEYSPKPYEDGPGSAQSSTSAHLSNWNLNHPPTSIAFGGLATGPSISPVAYQHQSSPDPLGLTYQAMQSRNTWSLLSPNLSTIPTFPDVSVGPTSPHPFGPFTLPVTDMTSGVPDFLSGPWPLAGPSGEYGHAATVPSTPFTPAGDRLHDSNSTVLDQRTRPRQNVSVIQRNLDAHSGMEDRVIPITPASQLAPLPKEPYLIFTPGRSSPAPTGPDPASFARPPISETPRPPVMSDAEIRIACKCRGGPTKRPSRHWRYTCQSNRDRKSAKRPCPLCKKDLPDRGDNFDRHQGTCKKKRPSR